MSDTPETPAQAPAQPAAPAQAQQAPAQTENQEPHWLSARLEREAQSAQKKLLSELGAASADEIKQALQQHRETQEKLKSEAEKAAEKLAELQRFQQENQRLAEVVKGRVNTEFSGLSEQQRAAVLALAGDDAAAQLRAIDALRPTWLTAPAPAANTAPARSAPAETQAAAPDHRQVYEQLKAENPLKANNYLIRHYDQIFSKS